jgi:hypothetical protein
LSAGLVLGSYRRPVVELTSGLALDVLGVAVVGVELDLFLADLPADGLRVGDGQRVQAHPLHRHGLGVAHRARGSRRARLTT